MNLLIERITEADLQFLNRVRNQYASEFLHDDRKFTIEETREWFHKTNPLYYLITDSNANRIGYFRITNFSKENKNLYIGADIAPEFRGKGYAKAAYKQFMPVLFEYYDLNKITLEVLSTNQIAINLYKSIGFVYEGTKRQEILRNGIWIDSIIMSILKNEFIKE